jgi:hypothetical protein
VALAYVQSQSTVVGEAGTVTTQDRFAGAGLSATSVARAGSWRFLRQTSGEGANARDSTVYGVDATASYAISRWLRVRVAYRYTLEDTDPEQIRYNIVSLSLDVTYPVPLPVR